VTHPTRAIVHLDRLARNLGLLSELAGERPLWPCIKANAYGHGAEIVARHLVALGHDTLCVAHATEALELRDYARIDVRLGPGGEVWVLEVNCNPYISFGHDMSNAAEKSGMDYYEFIDRIVHEALLRNDD